MYLKQYAEENFNFPSDDINPSEKLKPDYSLKWAKAVYSLHLKDKGGLRYSAISDMQMARLYAEGRQPVEKYLDILCPKDKNGQRKSYMDLSLDIVSIIPKFRSIIVGKFIQREHDIIANAIDEKSGMSKQNARLKLWTDAEISRMMKPFEEILQVGLPAEQIKGIIPETVEQLDMLEAAGAFKLKWEAGAEKLIKDAFAISGWQDIKTKAYEDLFDLGLFATRDYTCKETGKAKVRYVDPEKLVVRHSKDHVYKNIDYAGEILDLTPNQVRVDAGEYIPKEKLESIIKLYTNNDMDIQFDDNIYDLYERHGDMNIKVMDLTWKTINTDKVEKKTDARGNVRYYDKPYDYKVSEGNPNRELLVGKKHMVYKCKWIVGSDYVYDFGVEEDIIRKDKKNVELPFNIYRLTKKSMLASMIPFEDNIQLTWLKFQNALAKAAPSGIAVDFSAMKNITNGSKQLKPLELLKIRRDTGDFIYKSTTHHSQVISPTAGRPIIPIAGGVGSELDEFIKVIDFDINMLRQITGINEMMDATAPNPNTLVGTAQIAEQGTNNTLHNLYNAYKRVKENTASHLICRIQNIISYVDYKPYEKVVGTGLVNVFKQGSPIAESDYGISLSLKPQAAEKQSLLDKANFAFQQGMLRYSDLMYVEQEVIYGSIKMARIYLMYKEDQYRQEEEAKAAANVQQQSQAIQEQQANQFQINQALGEQETNNEIKKMEARKVFDIDEYAAKHEMKKDQDNNSSQNKVKENLLK
jgi:hypothetical protein